MDEISHQHNVHMKDEEKVKKIINSLIADGPDKLQVVADFDRTLTKYTENGSICATCHNVLEENGHLPDFFSEGAARLRDHYFPLEMSSNLTVEEKIPLMIEWWTKAHDLLSRCDITREGVTKMVRDSSARLRDGCNWLFDELDRHGIPLLIFSAGLGDILEEIIRQKSTLHRNMKIVSNYFQYNTEGKMVGFRGDIIHSYNKNEGAIYNSSYFQDIEHRHNILLLGDSTGDLHMADGAKSVKNKLTIGFLNLKVNENLEHYKRKFDIVIVEEEKLDLVNTLVRSIVQSKQE